MNRNLTLLALAHDMAVAALAYAVSLYLRLGHFEWTARGPWMEQTALFAVVCGGAFWVMGVYKGMWRYVSVRDLWVIVKAVTVGVLFYLLISFLVTRLQGMPRSVPEIVWFVLIAFLVAPRLFVRLLKEGRLDNKLFSNAPERVNVLVVGAGDEAESFIRAALQDRQSPYRVVGVLDHKESSVGRVIHNVSVLAPMRDLSRVVKELKIKGDAPRRLVIGRAASRVADFGNLMAQAQTLGLTLSRLPNPIELQTLGKRDLPPIDLGDLLGRPETTLDKQAIANFVQGKCVLITGAGGTIGSELSRQVAALQPARLILLDNSEFNLYAIELALKEAHESLDIVALMADVRESPRVMRIFEENHPNIIFHAAALKHVPMAEANVREALLTNVIGTRNVSDAAAATGADAMVLISTDKAVNPSSVMGASKRMAEHYCQALDYSNQNRTRFLTVRFGNVLGSTGSVVPRFHDQLVRGGPLTVTHPDITRYFMTVMEAVELVLQACAFGMQKPEARGRIMVLDMGRPIKIADLARQMIRLAGFRPDEDIKIVYTGLRPGEKLHEELFGEAEHPAPSGADGVLLAAAEALPFSHVDSLIRDLSTAVVDANANEELLRLKIVYLVPEFAPPAADTAKKIAHG
jgi:FlaA1/EpsC-like NDP-sugar epimerase